MNLSLIDAASSLQVGINDKQPEILSNSLH